MRLSRIVVSFVVVLSVVVVAEAVHSTHSAASLPGRSMLGAIHWNANPLIRSGSSAAGYRFDTLGSDIEVTALGRIWLPGNTGTKTIQIFKQSDKSAVTSVRLDMSRGDHDQYGFKYVALSTPVRLTANTAYYLISIESGTDTWYDSSAESLANAQSVTTKGGVYYTDSTGWVEQGGSGGNGFPNMLIRAVTTARPAGAYYVSGAAGCSDSGAGTQSAPWCTFAPVNASSFAPGSSILLARGRSFLGPLAPGGSGTSWTNPIYIGPYGLGAAPVILKFDQPSDRGIVLVDQDYIWIDNIEIARVGFGIVADYTTPGHQGLRITNVYAHDITGVIHWSPRQADFPNLYNSAAITIGTTRPPEMPSAQWLVKDIVIDALKTRNTAPLYITNPTDFISALPLNPSSTVRDVLVSNGDFANIPLPGVAMAGVSNVRLVNNTVDCSGHIDEKTGSTCIYLWHTSHVTVQNNQFCCMNSIGQADESEIDVEGTNDHVRIVGNLFHDTAGAAIELLSDGYPPPYGLQYITAVTIQGNTFYNNGNDQTVPFGHNGTSVWAHNDTPPWRSRAGLSDNVFRERTGLLSTGAWPSDFNYDASEFLVQTNNHRIGADLDIFSAPRDFGGPGVPPRWTYNYWDGSANRAAAWNATTGTWTFTDVQNGTTTTGSIGRYTMMPVATGTKWTIRTWVAPRAGSVVVNGLLAKVAPGGDGLNWGVTKNGAWLTPYNFLDGSDVVGQLTKLTTTVNAGDKIQFSVNSGIYNNSANDEVTWAPSVSYLP